MADSETTNPGHQRELTDHDICRIAKAAATRSISQRIKFWLGIAAGVIGLLVVGWRFGDGVFFTDAEASDEQKIRIASETEIRESAKAEVVRVKTAYTQDIADLILSVRGVSSRQDLQAKDIEFGKEAQRRLEGRIHRHEREHP